MKNARVLNLQCVWQLHSLESKGGMVRGSRRPEH